MFKRILSVVMAACMLIPCLSGCMENTEKSGDVTLVWYLRNAKPNNFEKVTEEVNKYTQEKIGVKVDLRCIEPSAYDEKMNLIMSAGEEFDICFTSNWSNSYVDKARDGAYVALDDYLKDYPELVNSMPEYVWESSKVDGNIYSIFNYQIIALPSGWWFRKDMIDKYNIDLSKVHNLNDMTPIFETIKKNEPNMTPAFYGDSGVALCAEQPDLITIEGFMVDQETNKLTDYLNVSDTKMPYHKLMREWKNKGFFSADIATASEADIAPIKSGKVFSGYNSLMPGGLTELEQNFGFELCAVELYTPYATPCIGCNNAISATSKHVKESMDLLNLVNTDKYLYNLLQYGIENEDYNFVDKENGIISLVDGGYRMETFLIGSKANAYLLEGKSPDVWKQTEELNQNLKINPYEGFRFDIDKSNVSSLYAQVKAIDQEYRPILKNGLDDTDKVITEYRERLKKAGIDDVRVAIQQQFDEWLASKNN